MQPVLFIGHGSPMNAIEDNPFTQALGTIKQTLPSVPKAILVVSAHWLANASFVSTTSEPKTIHDYFGFPPELYKQQYPAPGAKEIAGKLLKTVPDLKEDDEMGLDHGAWSILKHIFPKADIPVFQLSINCHKTMQSHYELGKQLSYLRSHNVLIIGSGNAVHNLGLYNYADPKPFDWAVNYNKWVKQCLSNNDYKSLIDYNKADNHLLAVPTNEHYIPMLYTLGATHTGDKLEIIYDEVISSISMLCFKLG